MKSRKNRRSNGANNKWFWLSVGIGGGIFLIGLVISILLTDEEHFFYNEVLCGVIPGLEEKPVPSKATTESKKDDQVETPSSSEKPAESKPDEPKQTTDSTNTPSKPSVPSTPNTSENPTPPSEQPTPETKPTDKTAYNPNQKLPAKPTYVKGILVANKQHPLPANYAPGESKVARAAFEEMAAAAKLAGYEFVAFSTYRSFDRQEELYTRYVARDGVAAADRYSARPGYSEHQTGLGFDIGEKNMEQHWAAASFGTTEAGKWIAAHAHEYGFIMRYPKGKESVTGYMHESWHFRYVGKAIANEIYTQNLTLEEYLGI